MKFEQPEPAHRSISNPVSLFELSVQARLIWLVETAVAARFVGAFGFDAPPPPPPVPPRPCNPESVIRLFGWTDRIRGSLRNLAITAASGISTDATFTAAYIFLRRAPLAC